MVLTKERNVVGEPKRKIKKATNKTLSHFMEQKTEAGKSYSRADLRSSYSSTAHLPDLMLPRWAELALPCCLLCWPWAQNFWASVLPITKTSLRISGIRPDSEPDFGFGSVSRDACMSPTCGRGMSLRGLSPCQEYPQILCPPAGVSQTGILWRWEWKSLEVGMAVWDGGHQPMNQSEGRGSWRQVLSHALSPLLVQFFQQADGGAAQLPETVLGWARAMHWASLWGPGGRLWAQGWGLEL